MRLSSSLKRIHPTIDSPGDFRKYGKKMVDMIADYHDNMREIPVVPDVKPGYISKILPDEAPQQPESWDSIVDDFNKAILPGITQWNSPHFHAYYPTANSYAAVMGGMLADAIGCVGFTWMASPACTELEMLTMDWLCKMLGFPEHFLHSDSGKGGGVIQGSASESTLVALLAAKHRKLSEIGDKSEAPKLVAYTSNQAHSSVEKGIRLVNAHIRMLDTDSKYRLRGDVLQRAIQQDREQGLIPFFVGATLGTTSVGSFDDIEELGNIANEEKLWMHIDAAYAGSAMICPEYRYLMKGIEKTDSIVLNAHKWLMTNFDCSAMFVRNSLDLVDAFNIDPLYLKHNYQDQIPDYRNWQLPLGRRFRALKLWMVLKSYGVMGLQENIRRQIQQAQQFEELVRADDRFEVFADVIMGLVCFRLRGDTNDANEELNRRCNHARNIHMTPAFVDGKFVLRFVVASRLTEPADISYAWDEIRKHTDDMESETCQRSIKTTTHQH